MRGWRRSRPRCGPTDMAFLHYRDAAFQIARALQVPGQDTARDMLLSFAASSEDPISGGRHKVLGSRALMIPPQTSTIASHLPKAVGAAFSIGLARRNPPEHRLLPDDALIVASFGDASANHSTAQGAFNTAQWTAYQNTPLPLLFVCEDNGIGISTKTPPGWIEASFSHRPGLTYLKADGLDLYETYRVAPEAAQMRAEPPQARLPAPAHGAALRPCRGRRAHDLSQPRRGGGGRGERPAAAFGASAATRRGHCRPTRRWRSTRDVAAEVEALAAEVVTRPRLRTASEVMASLIPPKRANRPTNGPSPEARAAVFGADLAAQAEPQPMSRHINWALTDLMLAHPEIVMMGEDVGRKGGVYGVTQKLHARFGATRVIDTILDEQSILGLGIGMAQNGFLPIPEIQFLAYLHNAEDQVRGEAATLPFFSNGQFTNPMVVRIAGLGYQKGFGGHFHNDNSIAVLRDIPGLILACPSTGADAAMMLRECVRLAREEQRVVVFLEPIALYPMRDLHAEKDGGWMTRYPAQGLSVPFGSIGLHGTGTDLAIVTYGNGHLLSRQAEPQLRAEGIDLRIIDLRWLVPLPEAALHEAVKDCARVLIVDECRRSGGPAEALMTHLAEAGHQHIARLTAEDSFIATGPAYAATLPSVQGIVSGGEGVGGKRKWGRLSQPTPPY